MGEVLVQREPENEHDNRDVYLIKSGMIVGLDFPGLFEGKTKVPAAV